MESTALQQAFDTCQNNEAGVWLQRKNELAAANRNTCGFCQEKAETSVAWTNYAILSKSENGR